MQLFSLWFLTPKMFSVEMFNLVKVPKMIYKNGLKLEGGSHAEMTAKKQKSWDVISADLVFLQFYSISIREKKKQELV